MDGLCNLWRARLRDARKGRWNVRLSLAQARLRREIALVYDVPACEV